MTSFPVSVVVPRKTSDPSLLTGVTSPEGADDLGGFRTGDVKGHVPLFLVILWEYVLPPSASGVPFPVSLSVPVSPSFPTGLGSDERRLEEPGRPPSEVPRVPPTSVGRDEVPHLRYLPPRWAPRVQTRVDPTHNREHVVVEPAGDSSRNPGPLPPSTTPGVTRRTGAT